MTLSTGDYESILIGAVLKFGKEAALSVLPQLTADKFVCNFGGSMDGSDNRHIWRAIENTVLVDHADPALSNPALRTRLEETLMPLAEGHLTDLSYRYKIEQIDVPTLRQFAREIHKRGIVFNLGRIGERLGKLTDPDLFDQYIVKVKDPEEWASGVIGEMYRMNEVSATQGYEPVSSFVDATKDQFIQQRSGEQTFLLPNGFPALFDAGLFPAECMALIHGFSSGGKSSLVENVINLGTAIELVHNGVRGCVAINSLEMNRKKFLARAASSLAGFNTGQFSKNPKASSDRDFQNFLDYLDFVGKLPIWVDDMPGVSMKQVKLRLMGIHLGPAGPVRQVSTDYLELLDFSGSEDSKEIQLSEIAAAHFDLKRELNTCVIAVSQTTYTGKSFVAGMYGARYSKSLAHKPDIVIELVNYSALKKSGTDYVVANGLDEDHVWLLLEKYRDGEPGAKIALGWEPEYTRLYDVGMMGIDQNILLFEHLNEVRKLLKDHPTTTIIPFADTPLAEIELPGAF